MNIIVISLKRAEERRKIMKHQLKQINQNSIIIDAVDGSLLSDEEKNKKLCLVDGYRFGELFKPGEIACTMSHINAIKYAKEHNFNKVIVLEDDVILAEDFDKRINLLEKMLPKKWDHIYLSGIPAPEPPFSITMFASLQKSVFTQCTHSMLINSSAYDKIISKLSLFETTTDDIYCDMVSKNELISYTLYPFVTYANDNYTYIWNKTINRPHPSKKYFKNKL